MEKRAYISVILPLKLEWEPCYYVAGSDRIPSVGERVKVIFSNKEYIGVISGVDINPDTDPAKIKGIVSFEDGMGKVMPEEIELWKQIAEYYLCTAGEVYKAAYPIGKVHLEEARSIAKEKAQNRKKAKEKALEARICRLKDRLQKKNEALGKARKDSVRERYRSEIEAIGREIRFHESSLMGKAYEQTAHDCGSVGTTEDTPSCTPDLSTAQKKAVEQVNKAFADGRPVLLNGVTGSGKTEIYISLALETMKQGRNVLYLVPEISLSRQLEDRLETYFGDRLMTYHSRETSADRRDTAEKIRALHTEGNGNYVVLGTRSSLFLPHHNLGLIIVDEEHDSSYKQDSPAPRYNGRDTALILSTIHKSNIILGSATPSLEELYNCLKGRHAQVLLSERFHGSDDSEIEIIDTRAERKKNGMKGSFSRKLIAHIEETISRGEQVIILRARRAWAPVMQCSNCGELLKCPHCNVSLSFHKSSNDSSGKLVCHWCGYTSPYTGKCSKCSGELVPFGAGTQKIEEEAEALFPQARIARLDSDTVQKRGYETKTIREFSEGKIDILIGTQIVTKGFDFSGLSLVAVIAADTLLGIQDFRADEKALQLLQQLRGRSGRRTRKGLFVIQTAQPDHPIYNRLNDTGEGSFSMDLLQERQDFGFPPYSRIIELTIKDIYEDRAERMATKLGRAFKGMNIMGPYAPAVSKVADRHIRMLRISLAKDRSLKSRKEAIRRLVNEFEKAYRYEGHITINVDPS